MKNIILNVMSGVVLSGLISSVSVAQDQFAKLTADCPGIGKNQLTDIVNYGNSLAGTGTIRVNSGPVSEPLFQGPLVMGANIPTNFSTADYFNNGVSFNPLNGAITCYYKSSSVKGYVPFSVSYIAKNSIGGMTTSSDSSEIHVKIPMALM